MPADDTPSTPSLFERLKLILARFLWRLSDRLLVGVHARRQQISLKGRVFDSGFYLSENPDVAAYGGPLVEHFFRYGLYENRRARFFDSNWYFDVHTDLKSARIDAWSHYCQYGNAEGRSVRYFYINSYIERFRNRNFDEWLLVHDKRTDGEARDMAVAAQKLGLKTRFLVLFVFDAGDDVHDAGEAITSVRAQGYEAFECRIGLTPGVAPELRRRVAALDDPRFTVTELGEGRLAAGFNQLAKGARAGYICALQSRDRLDAQALFWAAHAVHKKAPAPAVVYADEDRVDGKGRRSRPHFKPDFNYELTLSHNLMGDFTLYGRKLFEALRGFDAATDGDIHYDLALRAAERAGAAAVHHIPRLLNHVKLPDGAVQSDRAAVERHLKRAGRAGEVLPVTEAPGYTRVRFALPATLPHVTLVIPTRDRADLMRVCVESLTRTTYPNYDVIIVDNGSVETETFALFKSLDKKRYTVVRDDRPFNFSGLNNGAVARARGEFVCLMNNDIEILTPDWLEEMLSFAIQPGVGCVGARLWYPDGTIQHAGVLVGFHGVAGHMHKFTKRGETGYADRVVLHQSLSAVTAAVMLVRKAIWDEVGGFDEALAVAFNDVDFCLKVRNAGYRNVYTPYAEMNHHESASRGAETTPAKKKREQDEINLIKERYGDSMSQDPSFSPNLSLTSEDLSFAFPPRVSSLEDVVGPLRD